MGCGWCLPPGVLLGIVFVIAWQLQASCHERATARRGYVSAHATRAHSVMNGCRLGDPTCRSLGPGDLSTSSQAVGYSGDDGFVCSAVSMVWNPFLFARAMDPFEVALSESAGVVAGTQNVQPLVDIIESCECPVARWLPGGVQRLLSLAPAWSLSQPRKMYIERIPQADVVGWLNRTDPDFTRKNVGGLNLYLSGTQPWLQFYDENTAVVQDSKSITVVAQAMFLVRATAPGFVSSATYNVFVGQMEIAGVSSCGCDADHDTLDRAARFLLDRIRSTLPANVVGVSEIT